ncbi:RNA-binding protein, partial [Saitoella complicata NRRL Y-17804]
MAKRRQKQRTHVKKDADATAAGQKIPKSMVIRTGANEIGASLSQLVRDFRRVMEPHTASRLKERKANRLKDFVTMAGPLGVTHLMLFSRSENGVNLRIARTPRGPTLHFKVSSYSLARDIQKTQRNPKSPGAEYLTPPLLVLNNFKASGGKDAPYETLLTSTFQNLFPPISAQHTSLASIRRVLLLHRDPNDPEGAIDLRHYAITTKAVGVGRGVRKLVNGDGVADLGRVKDIADYVLQQDAGYNSESEVEDDAKVEVKREDGGARRRGQGEGTQQRAIKLVELGPRMRLHLTKVVEGVCDGKVLHHAHIKKTAAEEREQERKHKEKIKLKEARRKEQADNVARKKAEKDAMKVKRDE